MPRSSPPRFPTLRTARLLIRPVRRSDVRDLERLFHDRRVNRFLPYERRIERGEVYVNRAMRTWREDRGYRFVCRHRTTRAFVGTVGFVNVSLREGWGEIGYALARRWWGQGYATESAVALIAWGFDELHLHRIEAIVEAPNRASCHVLERLGFREEGRRRELVDVGRGRYDDAVLFGLLETEYRRRREPSMAVGLPRGGRARRGPAAR